MKDFIEFRTNEEIERILDEIDINEILSDDEVDSMISEFKTHLKDLGLNEEQIENLDEGILGKVLGGVAGFVIGPAIGKVIAKALGIEKGIMFDMLSSRLVGAALGSAITNKFRKK